MRISISPRERRTIAIAVAGAAVLILATRVVPVLEAWRQGTLASARELGAEVHRAEAFAALHSTLRDSLVVRRGRFLGLAGRLIAAPTRSAAAASLSSLVSGAAQAARLRVLSLEPRIDSTDSRTFARVTVHARLIGDVRGLAALLTTLEQHSSGLAIRELTVDQPDPVGTADRAEILGIRITVESLALVRRTRGEQ